MGVFRHLSRWQEPTGYDVLRSYTSKEIKYNMSCPMGYEKNNPLAGGGESAEPKISPAGAACPVSEQSRKALWEKHQDTSYDPSNMMPPPNQIPAPGQKRPLSTHRIVS